MQNYEFQQQHAHNGANEKNENGAENWNRLLSYDEHIQMDKWLLNEPFTVQQIYLRHFDGREEWRC